MTDFLNTQTGDITEFDDKLVRKLVEKATVYNDRIVVEFKSGLEIEVDLQLVIMWSVNIDVKFVNLDFTVFV